MIVNGEAAAGSIDSSGKILRKTRLIENIGSHEGAISLKNGIGLVSLRTFNEVRVFHHNAGIWSESPKIVPPGNLPGGCRFGASLDQSAQSSIIGAPALGPIREQYGNRGVAVITGPEGLTVTLKSPFPGNSPSFGTSVAMGRDGNTVFVGEPYIDQGLSPGRVHEFRRDPILGQWQHQAMYQAGNAEPADEFGVSLDVSEDGWLLVGAKTSWVYFFRMAQ